jgi:hypothetical protein
MSAQRERPEVTASVKNREDIAPHQHAGLDLDE